MFFHVIIVTWDLLSCSLTLPYPESPVQEAHHFLEYVPIFWFWPFGGHRTALMPWRQEAMTENCVFWKRKSW